MHALAAAFRPLPAALAGLLTLTGLLSWPAHVLGSQPAATPASAASRPQQRASSAVRKPAAAPRADWQALSPAQQQALAPLASSWPTLSAAQKRKWLAMSRNFQKLSPEERAKLYSRMTDWVALSPQQRTQARLNFGETQALTADDKKAKWEAYQALPEAEKKRLAERAQTRTPPTAAAVKPVPPQKLATVPDAPPDARRPRITGAPPAAAPMTSPGPLRQN